MKRIKVLVVSSCDALADVACGGLFGSGAGHDLVGVVKTSWPLSAKVRLLRLAACAGSLYYAFYAQAEVLLASWNMSRGRKARPEHGMFGAETLLQAATARGVPIHPCVDVNDAGTVAFMEGLGPDVVLSIRPGHIFREAFIGRAPLIINVHCAPLPGYRGMAAVMRVLADGRETLPCTAHVIDGEGVDCGPVAGYDEIDVSPGGSVFSHTFRAFALAPGVLSRVLDDVAQGGPALEEQGESPCFSWPGRDVWRTLRIGGHGLMSCKDLVLYNNL